MLSMAGAISLIESVTILRTGFASSESRMSDRDFHRPPAFGLQISTTSLSCSECLVSLDMGLPLQRSGAEVKAA